MATDNTITIVIDADAERLQEIAKALRALLDILPESSVLLYG